MTIERFAEEHKLRISQDDCGDDVIHGKHGHLYVDAGVVCAIWTNATPMKPSNLATLGGLFWQGNLSPDAKGRRVQDAWVKGIDLKPSSRQFGWSERSGGESCLLRSGRFWKVRVWRAVDFVPPTARMSLIRPRIDRRDKGW